MPRSFKNERFLIVNHTEKSENARFHKLPFSSKLIFMPLSSTSLRCSNFIKNTSSYVHKNSLKAVDIFQTTLKKVTNCTVQKIHFSYFYASTKGYKAFCNYVTVVSANCFSIYAAIHHNKTKGPDPADSDPSERIACAMTGVILGIAGTAFATIGFHAVRGLFKNSLDFEIDTWAQTEINKNPSNDIDISIAADKIRQACQTRQIELDLSHHDLTTLPITVWKLTDIRRLNLSYNHLQNIPPEIKQLTNLENLNVRNNQLHSLPNEIACLNNLQILNLHSNFIPHLHLAPKHNELLRVSDIEVGRLIQSVLALLVEEQQITTPKAISVSVYYNGLINQLLNYAARSNDQPTREASIRLRTQYNNASIIREIIEAAGYAYDEEDDLIWINPTGNRALLVKQDFYNKNILHIADQNNYAGRLAEWNHYSSIVRNEEGGFAIQEADQTGDIQQILNPFPLLSNAYRQANRLLMLHSYLNTLAPNIPEGEAFEALDTEQQELLIRYPGYIQRFKEALLVDCYPNADQEKRLVQPSDQSALWQMLANTFVVPVREVIGQDDMLNEAHFASIITALGLNRATADAQASHLFVLAAIFTKYSSAAIFGKEYQGENISPGALRRYAVGLVNKAHQLAPNVIPRIDRYKHDLIRGACSNILFGDMKSNMRGLFTDNPALSAAFETLMPIAWR